MVVGHTQNKKWLNDMFDNNSLPNTLLFVGERGVGKKSVAFSFASFVEEGKGSFSDFNEITNKAISINQFYFSNIKIGEVRDLIKTLSKTAFSGKKRIIIIDDVESWSYEVANSFLKLLEEPSDNIIFILMANNKNRVISTIRSRSTIFSFFPVENDVIRESVDTKDIEDISFWWDKKPDLVIDLLSDKDAQESIREMKDDISIFLGKDTSKSLKVIEKYKGDNLKDFFYGLVLMIRSKEEYKKDYRILKEYNRIFRKINTNINLLLVLRRLALYYT